MRRHFSKRPDYLLTPRDLADQHDIAGILKYCQEEIRIADYRGFARGAYGTIWAGEANEWDCAALAVAALEAEGQQARIIAAEGAVRIAYRDGSGESWNVVDLQQPAPHQTLATLPDQSKAALPVDQTLAVTLVLNRKGDDSELLKSEALPLHEWVSKPAVVNTVGDGGQLSLELTLGADTLWRSQSLESIERPHLEPGRILGNVREINPPKIDSRFRNSGKYWQLDQFAGRVAPTSPPA